MSPRRLLRTTCLAAAAAALVAVAAATEPAATDPAAKPGPARAALETEALQFAREHHPELAALIDRLHSSNRRAYRSAIQDLSRDRQRLERIRERTPDRYDFELQLWKLDSRIRLLAAHTAMGGEDVRPRLRALISQRQQLRLERLRQDRERLAARLERLDGTIREMEARPEAALDEAVEEIIERARDRASEVRAPAAAAGRGDRRSETGRAPATPAGAAAAGRTD